MVSKHFISLHVNGSSCPSWNIPTSSGAASVIRLSRGGEAFLAARVKRSLTQALKHGENIQNGEILISSRAAWDSVGAENAKNKILKSYVWLKSVLS